MNQNNTNGQLREPTIQDLEKRHDKLVKFAQNFFAITLLSAIFIALMLMLLTGHDDASFIRAVVGGVK